MLILNEFFMYKYSNQTLNAYYKFLSADYKVQYCKISPMSGYCRPKNSAILIRLPTSSGYHSRNLEGARSENYILSRL